MSLDEFIKRAAADTLTIIGGAAILSSPLVATNTLGYKSAQMSYQDTPCAEYQPPREDVLTFVAVGIGRQVYIRDKCGTQLLE